jgi:hypothetical protein
VGDNLIVMSEPGLKEGASSDDIRDTYEKRLAARRRSHEKWTRLDRRVADVRLVVMSVAVVLAILILRGWHIGYGWPALAAGLFVILVLSHEPVRKMADRTRRAVEFYAKGMARLDERWAGTGVTGDEFLDLDHPYAADLDIFGRGSLFERLCTARTRAGEETLAAWLLASAPRALILERQAAITELRPHLDLREDLELLGYEIRTGIDPAALISWGKSDRVFTGFTVPVIVTLLGILGTTAVIGWLFLGIGLLPLFVVLVLDGVVARFWARSVKTVLSAVDRRTHDLVLLAELLRRLEREPFESPLLQRLEQMLRTDGLPASAQIQRLARLLQLLDCQRNQLFLPLAVIWLWRIQMALRIDAWRAGSGHAIADWLAAVGEFEALCSLATYTAENPSDPFATVTEGAACYDAESLGHPLIPRGVCVCNDVRLGSEAQVYIVSGSNMSGKSTLLRSVGINAVLALAGAPVRARSFRLAPLAVGATLRIQDSLQAGRSRFYAEITRVRQLVDRANGPLPLLFLFDELFHGTNSHDRAVGAESVLRGLIERGAIGLITTHDLALARIADNLTPRVINVHFEDYLENGIMHFDYRMRPGVVQHSNALALMRAIGLEV